MLRTLLRPSTALGASLKTSRVVPLAARALHTRLLVPAHLPLRAVAAHPTFVRFKTTRSAWAQNPIVDYNELKPITEQPSDDILLIDVREPDEVALGSVPSSVNLPLSQLPDALGKMNESEFQNKFMFPKPTYDQKIIFYCRSGKRSASACELANEKGWANVRNYQGSWLDWSKREKQDD